MFRLDWKRVGGFVACCVALGVVSAGAQSLGELAQEQRAKKSSDSCLAPRVLTEDDLKRPRILTEEERACLEAARKETREPSEQAVIYALELPLTPPPGGMISLGEIARHYRALKELREAQRAAVLMPEASPLPSVLVASAPPAPADNTARFAAAVAELNEAKRPEPVPTESATLSAKLVPPPSSAPLGDIARYYRALAQARAAEAARPEPLAARNVAAENAVLPGALAEPPAPTAPLGDIARYYRLLKRREERAAGPAPQAPQVPVLAAPTFSAAPKTDLVPPRVAETPKREAAEAVTVMRELPRRAEPVAGLTVRIERGDCLWKLAAQHLGAGARWREIASVNPQITNPDRIFAGDSLRLPAIAASQAEKQVRVTSGDTLWRLARAEFGSGTAWVCIARANPRIANPDRILPGQMLALPASCSLSR